MLSLRKITQNDIDLLFNWANDPEVRKNAFHSNIISYEEHKDWFTEKINSKSTYIFILDNDNIPIGQIRFDLEKDSNSFLIDYSISKEKQGRGFGIKIIELGLLELMKNKTLYKVVRAFVKSNNIASQKCFLKNNFRVISEKNEYIEFVFYLTTLNV